MSWAFSPLELSNILYSDLLPNIELMSCQVSFVASEVVLETGSSAKGSRKMRFGGAVRQATRLTGGAGAFVMGRVFRPDLVLLCVPSDDIFDCDLVPSMCFINR